ncbi:MAG: hypothetical protein CL682_14040 [Brevundimonas sp.]|nr:hypothetical protein [Brevundimonas sp.]
MAFIELDLRERFRRGQHHATQRARRQVGNHLCCDHILSYRYILCAAVKKLGTALGMGAPP